MEEAELKKMIIKFNELFKQFNNLRTKINESDLKLGAAARSSLRRSNSKQKGGMIELPMKIDEEEENKRNVSNQQLILESSEAYMINELIQDRQKEFDQIQSSMENINKMTQDMAREVFTQDEILNLIVNNLADTKDNLSRAEDELIQKDKEEKEKICGKFKFGCNWQTIVFLMAIIMVAGLIIFLLISFLSK